jgi:hypothetical protein
MMKILFAFALLCLCAMPAVAAAPQPGNQDDGALVDYYRVLNPEAESSIPYNAYHYKKTDERKDDDGGFVSFSVNQPYDLGWGGMLEVEAPSVRNEVIILPFLQDFPIENIEIKLRLLNQKF